MARKRSEFLAGMGKAFQIFKALADAVLARGGDDGDLERLLKDRGLLKQIVGLIMAAKTVIGNLVIKSSPFDPVAFVGRGWRTVAEEHDARSAALTEVDFSKVDFVTCLKEGESSITGEQKLERLKASGHLRFGATVFMGLWNDYLANGENCVLERLYQEKGITYLDFFGDVLLNPGGDRFVLYVYRSDAGEWVWRCYWLDCDWDAFHVSAVRVSA